MPGSSVALQYGEAHDTVPSKAGIRRCLFEHLGFVLACDTPWSRSNASARRQYAIRHEFGGHLGHQRLPERLSSAARAWCPCVSGLMIDMTLLKLRLCGMKSSIAGSYAWCIDLVHSASFSCHLRCLGATTSFPIRRCAREADRRFEDMHVTAFADLPSIGSVFRQHLTNE